MPRGNKTNHPKHSGQFKGKDDPRNNTAGQRSREVVATAAQARALYVQVLHEPINTAPDPAMSNLEMIVRQHVQAARKGDAGAREQMFDRLWGKSAQPITGKDGGPIQHEDVSLDDTERLARIDALFERVRARRAG